jgi:homopolymeric O-antigen transport system ATP-binding protein
MARSPGFWALRGLDRCLLLDHGQRIDDGPPDRVLDHFNALIATREASMQILQAESKLGLPTIRSGTFEARLTSIDVLDHEGKSVRAFKVGDRACLRCLVHFAVPLQSPTVGLLIRDRLGNDVFGTNTYYVSPIAESYEAGDELEVEFDIDLNLGVGTYTVTAAVHSYDTHVLDNYDWWDKVIAFQTVPGRQPWFIGAAWLPLRVLTRPLKRNVLAG